MLNLLNRFNETPNIEVVFDWEIYGYRPIVTSVGYSGEMEDYCNKIAITMNVPRLKFSEYVQILLEIKRTGYPYRISYINKVDPLHSNNDIWMNVADSIEKLNDYVLTYTRNFKTYWITLFWIEEFQYYAAINLYESKR